MNYLRKKESSILFWLLWKFIIADKIFTRFLVKRDSQKKVMKGNMREILFRP